MAAPLSASQRARFRRAYRDAYASTDRDARANTMARFEELYGVSHDTLIAIAIDDQSRNPQVYKELRVVRAKRYQDAASSRPKKHTEPEGKGKARRNRRAKRKVDASSRGNSVWTLSGGLPSLGKGHR